MGWAGGSGALAGPDINTAGVATVRQGRDKTILFDREPPPQYGGGAAVGVTVEEFYRESDRPSSMLYADDVAYVRQRFRSR